MGLKGWWITGGDQGRGQEILSPDLCRRCVGRSGGDLVVELFVETPTKLTARQKELMRELAECCGEQQHPQSAVFFGKAKKFWVEATGA